MLKDRFIRGVECVNTSLGLFAGVLFLPLTAILTVEVFSRYVLGRPSTWAWEVVVQLAAAIVLIGGAYTILSDAHAKVDIIPSLMSIRRRAVIDLVTSSLFFVAFAVLIWKGGERGIFSVQIGERYTGMANLPIYVLRMIVPIGAFMMLLQGVVKLIRDLNIARNSK